MKLAEGPRPWTIWSFCAINLVSGVFELVRGLSEVEFWIAELNTIIPDTAWTRDDVIVLHSAIFTIILIPIIAIWFFRSRLARTLVTAFSALAFAGLILSLWESLPISLLDWIEVGYALAMIAIIALLYSASAERWFSRGEAVDAAEFE